MSKIKIIQTSDIHSYMFPKDYIKKNISKNQGLLRFKNYIEKQREDYEVLLIDSGDMFQGSALSFFVNNNIEQYEVHPITEAMNNLKYDIFTLGNHEFNYGFEYMEKSLNKLDAEIIIANVENLNEHINIKPYIIKEIGGLKIAIIGFITAAVPNFEKEENIINMKFLSIIDTYKKYEKELLSKSDLIIVNYHGGFEGNLDSLEIMEKNNIENEGIKFLQTFSSVDIFLTGHQHQEICQKVNNTQIVQPGINGSKISEITINNKEIEAKLINTNNMEVPSILSLNTLDEKVENYLDIPFGHATENLLLKDAFLARLNSHPLVNFINQVQLDYTKADISAMSLFDNAMGFKKEITMRQILANYPFPNEVVMLEITKEDLKEALEVSASYFNLENKKIVINSLFTTPKLQNYQYDMFSGFYYEMDITKPIGSRVVKIELPKNINEKKIKIALNNYRAANHSWYPMYKDKKVLFKSSEDMISILINYIQTQKIINIDKNATFKVKY